MLKRDELQNGPQKGLLEKALELPLPIMPETRDEELIRLSQDVEALIDTEPEAEELLRKVVEVERTRMEEAASG